MIPHSPPDLPSPLQTAWLGFAGGLLTLYVVFACTQSDANMPLPGETGFDSLAYCEAHPKNNGCCLQEASHTIDFEDASVETLSPLSNRYKSRGLEFTSGSAGPYILTGKFEGNQIGNAAVSGQNALMIGFNHTSVRIHFVNPEGGGKATTNHVSATVGDKSNETDLITFTGYDFSGNAIASDTFVSQPSGKVGDHDFGEVSLDTAGIYYVVVDDTSSSGADLDDLTYGCIHYQLN